MIRIGGLTIHGRTLCAPFSGISNMPFRVLARKHGAALVFTEMVKARPWVDGNTTRTHHMIAHDEGERPVFAQIATGEVEEARRITQLVYEAGFDGIDLNMGCPVKKISKSKCGAYLLGHPELVSEIVSAMEAVASSFRTETRPFPVTVKTRAGLSAEHVNAMEIAHRVQDAGGAAITIHARTKDQVHSGATKRDVVAAVKQSLQIPVFFNGGVNSPQIADEVMRDTGADGVMIGRASFGNPWIFGRVEDMITHRKLNLAAPTLAELKDTMTWHFGAVRKLFGDATACRLMRKYGCWYITGVHSGAQFRHAVSRLESPDQFAEVVEQVFAPWPADAPAPLAEWYDAESLSRTPDESWLTNRGVPVVE
ncbi:MAG: tRNA dihydrouridine synthase DusB [Planctomycetota bacterium]